MGGLSSSIRAFDIDPSDVPKHSITAAIPLGRGPDEAVTAAIKQLRPDEKARPTTPSTF
jgi:hypothetical protein